MRLLIFFLYLIFLSACTTGEDYIFEEAIHEDLQPYFKRFNTEAAARGIIIDWTEENISTNLTDISEGAVGQCLTFEQGKNQINIDQTYWNKSSELLREFLIFHELGHCILKRDHYDEANFDGTCKSMMNSGENICRKNYNLSTREDYIDELFS